MFLIFIFSQSYDAKSVLQHSDSWSHMALVMTSMWGYMCHNVLLYLCRSWEGCLNFFFQNDKQRARSSVSTQVLMLIAEQPTHTLVRGEENVMSSFFHSICLLVHACVYFYAFKPGSKYTIVKYHYLCWISVQRIIRF